MTVKISPSLAAAPLTRLEEVVTALEAGGADYIHIDIEDGSFVPVMTLGTRLIPELRPLTRLPFDMHLMMVEPEWLIPQLVEWGADRIAVHLEACPYPRRTLGLIDRLGAQAGLALNPVTPTPELTYLAPFLKFVILLSTEPEVEDCPFIPQVLDKLRQAKQTPGAEALEWVVDGGVSQQNVKEVVAAGADTVVVGRSAFKDGQVQKNLETLRSLI